MSDLANKGFCASTMTYYAVTYAEIREVARQHGYALCLHGSLRNDLDVLAVPWTEEASDMETLVRAIVEASGGYLVCNREGQHHGIKPHGRIAWTIHFGGCSETIPPDQRATYIDLSVMPKIVPLRTADPV